MNRVFFVAKLLDCNEYGIYNRETGKCITWGSRNMMEKLCHEMNKNKGVKNE